MSGRALEVPEGQNPWFSLCFTMILEIVALSAGAYFGLPKRSRPTPVQPNARRTPLLGARPPPSSLSPGGVSVAGVASPVHIRAETLRKP